MADNSGAISISGFNAASGDRTLTLDVIETSYDAVNNTSKIKWTLTVSGTRSGNAMQPTYVKCTVNGSVVYEVEESRAAFPCMVGSRVGTATISHNSDGKKTIQFSIEGFVFTPPVYTNREGLLNLTDLDRVPPTVTATFTANPTSIVINASANADCNLWQYSINGGVSWVTFSNVDQQSATYTITGLTPNTNYLVQVRARKTINQIFGEQSVVSVKTPFISTIEDAVDKTLGNACNIKWTPLGSPSYFKLNFALGSWSHTTDFITYTGTAGQQYTYGGYQIPLSVANQLPNSTSGTMTVRLDTYTAANTNSYVGSDTSSFTVTVPSSVVPTISATFSPTPASIYSSPVSYVKTLAKAVCSATVTTAYSATVAGVTFKVGSAQYTMSKNGSTYTATSATLNTAGNFTLEAKVTDSRGRTATQTTTITVYDYWKPTITMSLVVDQENLTVQTIVSGSIAPVNNQNIKRLTITRTKVSDPSDTQTATYNPLDSYTYSKTWSQSIADVDIESYEYTATVTDTKQSVTVKALTAAICISRLAGGRGVTLFREATQEGFWVRTIRYDLTDAEYLEIARYLANDYSASATYYEGQFTIYNSKIWECKTAITTSEAWNANHWTELGSA